MHERCWSLHMGIADAMHTPGRERQNAVLTDMASEASSPNVLQEPSANIFGVPDLEVPCVAVETLPVRTQHNKMPHVVAFHAIDSAD
jgi:hypothetical protein